MTPKQAAKQKTLYEKLVAGCKVKESEYPAWQKNAGKSWQWTPADDTENEYSYRAAYETAMRAIYGQSWEPNPAAIDWNAYQALERGECCDVCGRPGPSRCGSCDEWYATHTVARRVA